MNHRAKILASLLALIVAGLVALTGGPAAATFTGSNGLILFNRGGNLFTATATGGNIKQITTSGGISGAKWSPDGKRIAYRVGTNLVVRTVATGKTVTVAVGSKTPPIWSPNGQTIAFAAELPSAPCGEQGFFSAPAVGGSTPRVIWDPQQSQCDGDSPGTFILGGYTSDGKGILFTGCGGFKDWGCGIQELTLDPSSTTALGRRAFLGVNCSVEAAFPDDGSPSLCNYGLHLSDPRIAPVGNSILFTGKGGYDPASTYAPWMVGTLPGSTPLPTATTLERIYTVDRSGSGLHMVSTSPGGVNPTWSPKGDQVLFTQKSGTTNNLMRVVGTSATAKATVLINNASQADWQPIP